MSTMSNMSNMSTSYGPGASNVNMS
jgi:hypothetical protein